ncbi:hypothetical protein SAMN03159488_05152 [Pseudomonas sp. NFIX10]|uniref:hypothetical protein n=1 Tax=unclassified Pseudomonas TaxID=196821 RepID=UPI0008E18D6F|nr:MULTISPECIES: hypothetical protein [unclassified Pseudomonas]SFB55423.1 hypothetical protein SAMN03159488_05152 [Pseudomonas sp. NFIX10]SFF43108.1 hypothetical protein SAMN03159367_04516 [Pseudomonas sp. NFACC06-1]
MARYFKSPDSDQGMAGATALLHVVYCFMIRKIVAQDYLRKGWIEVADPKAVETSVH